MTPIFKLLANKKDVTKLINMDAFFISFKDEAGSVSDEITLKIQGSFKKPSYEDELQLWIGTKEKDLFFCGVFKVQTSTYNKGKSIYMSITATGADFSKNLKVKRSLSYENVSIKKIVEIVASRHNLEVSSDFDDIYVVHLEQTNESDLHFLKRLAQEDNAIFSIKNNTVIFKKKIKNNKKSKDLPRFSLDEDECENVSIENTNKTLYNSCKAIWRDTKENIQKSITVGSGEPIKVIKDSFENVAQAKLKARAALEKANAGLKSGSIACYGFEIYAGGILDLTGTYDDDGDYDIKRVDHTVDESGWNINIEIDN